MSIDAHRYGLKLVALTVLLASVVVTAGPLRYPRLSTNAIRVEKHLMPAVSTGPLDPAWSPDGRWIAFSMQGDVWKVEPGGGAAIALTQGPGYYFEPAWSPDSSRLAVSMDLDGNLDIGVVSAAGGPVERLTNGPQVDVEPTWSRDGRHIYFVTGARGNLDIHGIDVTTRVETPIINGPGNDVQPSVSPDGRSLAYVSPVEGRVGDGGIWITSLSSHLPKLIHFEETSFRTKPVWDPNGQAFIYVSDETGPNHIASVPVNGGNPVWLTRGSTDEYAPAVSPDGSTVAFVSNRTGATELFTMPIAGARADTWAKVEISDLRPRTPRGRLRATVLGPDGRPTPARIQIVASDGRAYAPHGGFHRVIPSTETHYFHTGGRFELRVPTGTVQIEALKGFEYQVAKQLVEVPQDGSVDVTLQLKRLVDMPALGWYSGDDHIHDLHQGRYGLTHETFFLQLKAEDIHVTNALIHMDGTRLMGRWGDLTGSPQALSTKKYILFYGEEFRGRRGHVGLLGIKKFILPFIAGVGGTVYDNDHLEGWYVNEARKQGGIGGFVHPYGSRVAAAANAANSELAVEAALGNGDFYDIASVPSDEVASTEMYYRFQNVGIRLPATGGTDNFSDVWRDEPPGTARTYAHLTGPLTFASWLKAVKAGHTFGTNGPLLFLNVNGKQPGDEIQLSGSAPSNVTVHAEAKSLAPLDKLEIVANGVVIHSQPASGTGTQISVTASVSMPAGGWIAARTIGRRHRYNADSYPFAQTTPVYIVRDGKQFTSTSDAAFLLAMVDEFSKRIDSQGTFHTSAERNAYRAQIQRARAIYEGIVQKGAETSRGRD